MLKYKQKLKIIPLILKWIFLIVFLTVPLFLIVDGRYKEIYNETILNEQLTKDVFNTNEVTEILGLIQDKHFLLAREKFENISAKTTEIPDEVITYLKTFLSIDFSIMINYDEEFSYLFNHLTDMINYLHKECGIDEPSAYSLSEIIPYYCIIQNIGNAFSKKNISYCDIYLKNISGKLNSLSEKGAFVICIKLKTMLKDRSTGNKILGNNDVLKTITHQIENYQNQYKNELGETNPKYFHQAEYLRRLKTQCDVLRNSSNFIKHWWKDARFDDKIPGLQN